MAKLNMAAIQARASGNSETPDPTKEKATFRASNLAIQITDQDTGEVVIDGVMTPRGFTAKSKADGTKLGGVGWYLDARGDHCGTYRGLPVNAGMRVSLDGLKVSPSDVVDLTEEADEE